MFGFLPAFLPVLIAHGRSFLPPHLVGRGMTLFNIGTMGGTFVVQLVSGALIDLFPAQAGVYPLEPTGWCSPRRRWRSCVASCGLSDGAHAKQP